jgi:DNA-binding CsgD family transcriptional regulator
MVGVSAGERNSGFANGDVSGDHHHLVAVRYAARMRLFGRDRESASLEAFFGNRPDGHRLLLLRGDPGSGKSALLESAAAMAPPGLVLSMGGLEALRQVELAASMGMLNRLVVESGAETLLTRILDDDPGARVMPVQLYEATRRTLEGRSASLLIDDVQWLDNLSLGLILYLLKNSQEPSYVVAASRPGFAASSFIEEARKSGADPLLLEIGPLDEAHGTELAMSLRPSLSREEARSIWERSGGLPYWLIALSADREHASSDELLTSRLGGASSDVISLLIHLAVLGRSVAVEGLGAMLDWGEARVEEAVHDLESRALIRRRLDQVSLVHDLIREEAMAQAGEESSREAHLRIARYLEAMTHPRMEILLEALHHRLKAGAPARSQALALLGSPRRQLLGEDGLASLVRAADQPGEEGDEAALLRREVAQLATEIGAAETALRRWLQVFEQSKDPVERTWAACQISRIALRSEDFAEARRWLDMARGIPDPDRLNRIEMAILEAGLLLWGERRQQEGHAVVAMAMAHARDLGLLFGEDTGEDRLGRAPAVRADVLQAAYDSAMISSDQLKSLEVASTMVEAARSELEMLVALGQQGRALMRVGRPAEARSILEALWQQAHEMALVTMIVRFGPAYAQSLYETGSLAEAARVADEVIPVAERHGSPRSVYFAQATIALSTLVGGDWRSGLDAMRASVEGEKDPHYRLTLWQTAATYLSRTMGTRSPSEVSQMLEAGWSDAGLAGCTRCASEFALGAAEASARAGMPDDAERWIDQFREAGAPSNPLIEAGLQVSEALIDGGPDLLQLARSRLSDMGYAVEQLWIGLDLASARAAQAGRPQAADTYREVAGEAEQLGAVTIQLLAEKSLRDLGARTWRRTVSGETLGLTQRELEVAQMAAAGSSNREIAEALFLSKKTVERHLSNILAKAGVRNRVELAGLLAKKAGDNEGIPR